MAFMGFVVVELILLIIHQPIQNKNRSSTARLDDSIDRKSSSVFAES